MRRAETGHWPFGARGQPRHISGYTAGPAAGAPASAPLSLSFQVHFWHYQQGLRIVSDILPVPSALGVHFRLSGLDLYGLMLAPCLLGCAGTER